jgi:hypothetical protein
MIRCSVNDRHALWALLQRVRESERSCIESILIGDDPTTVSDADRPVLVDCLRILRLCDRVEREIERGKNFERKIR